MSQQPQPQLSVVKPDKADTTTQAEAKVKGDTTAKLLNAFANIWSEWVGLKVPRPTIDEYIVFGFLIVTIVHTHSAWSQYETNNLLAWPLAFALDAGLARGGYMIAKQNVGWATRGAAFLLLIGFTAFSYALNVSYYQANTSTMESRFVHTFLSQDWVPWALGGCFPMGLLIVSAMSSFYKSFRLKGERQTKIEKELAKREAEWKKEQEKEVKKLSELEKLAQDKALLHQEENKRYEAQLLEWQDWAAKNQTYQANLNSQFQQQLQAAWNTQQKEFEDRLGQELEGQRRQFERTLQEQAAIAHKQHSELEQRNQELLAQLQQTQTQPQPFADVRNEDEDEDEEDSEVYAGEGENESEAVTGSNHNHNHNRPRFSYHSITSGDGAADGGSPSHSSKALLNRFKHEKSVSVLIEALTLGVMMPTLEQWVRRYAKGTLDWLEVKPQLLAAVKVVSAGGATSR